MNELIINIMCKLWGQIKVAARESWKPSEQKSQQCQQLDWRSAVCQHI